MALAPTRQGPLSEAELELKPVPVAPETTKFQKFMITFADWSRFQSYLKSEFDPPYAIEDIGVLVSEESGQVWYTTCKDYVNWRWETFGLEVLEFVNSTLEVSQDGSSGKQVHLVLQSRPRVNLQVHPGACTLSISCEGPQDDAQEIADILGWLFDSLRYDDVGTSGSSVIVQSEASETVYQVVAPSSPVRSSFQSNCWLPLFSDRKVISRGKIAHRPQGMRGLEIVLPELLGLSGADLLCSVNGGTYFDGLQSELYPISKDTESQSLQWHLNLAPIATGDNEDEAYDDSCWKGAPSDWFKACTAANITTAKRHFVD